jgi:hypothetical protein
MTSLKTDDEGHSRSAKDDNEINKKTALILPVNGVVDQTFHGLPRFVIRVLLQDV